MFKNYGFRSEKGLGCLMGLSRFFLGFFALLCCPLQREIWFVCSGKKTEPTSFFNFLCSVSVSLYCFKVGHTVVQALGYMGQLPRLLRNKVKWLCPVMLYYVSLIYLNFWHSPLLELGFTISCLVASLHYVYHSSPYILFFHSFLIVPACFKNPKKGNMMVVA